MREVLLLPTCDSRVAPVCSEIIIFFLFPSGFVSLPYRDRRIDVEGLLHRIRRGRHSALSLVSTSEPDEVASS